MSVSPVSICQPYKQSFLSNHLFLNIRGSSQVDIIISHRYQGGARDMRSLVDQNLAHDNLLHSLSSVRREKLVSKVESQNFTLL